MGATEAEAGEDVGIRVGEPSECAFRGSLLPMRGPPCGPGPVGRMRNDPERLAASEGSEVWKEGDEGEKERGAASGGETQIGRDVGGVDVDVDEEDEEED